MFDYNICKEVDQKAFIAACKKIENNLTAKKEPILKDVDGSEIQVYYKDDKKIKVLNDYEVDAVYIESEINLDKLFN